MKTKTLSVCLILFILLMFAANLNNVKASPTYEDFTTYTEVDPNNYIQKTANHIDAVLWRNKALTAVYKDGGAGHFQKYEHKIDVSLASANNYGVGIFWSTSNSNTTVFCNDNGAIAVAFCRKGTGEYYMQLVERDASGNQYSDPTPYTLSASTYYYLRIQKNGTAMTAKIYSTASLRDAGGTPDIDTLSLTLKSDYAHRYLYAARNYENNVDEPEQATLDIDNLDLQQKEWFLSETWQTTIHVRKWFSVEIWQITVYTLKWFLSEVWSLINIYGNVSSYGIYTTDIFPSFVFFMFALSIVITFICVFPVYRRRGKK